MCNEDDKNIDSKDNFKFTTPLPESKNVQRKQKLTKHTRTYAQCMPKRCHSNLYQLGRNQHNIVFLITCKFLSVLLSVI